MFSTYEERIAQTPRAESGRWKGRRGESLCAPSSSESKELLKQKGLEGIEYKNGMPDFSLFSESTVDVPYMTKERSSRNILYGRDGRNTQYLHDGNEQNTSKRSPDSMEKLMMKYDDPGNFQQADILTAQNWSRNNRDNRLWTVADVAQYRKDHKLTWHECNDGKTMQMIPRALNSDFGHLGGVSETAKKHSIIAEEAQRSPELTASNDEMAYINNINDQQLQNHFHTKHNSQDAQPQDDHLFKKNDQNTKEEMKMDKKKEWKNQIQQWKAQTQAYQEKQRAMRQNQTKVVKKTNASSSDTNDMDNMQRQRQLQKKKEQEISR